jgi:hypothetical protein
MIGWLVWFGGGFGLGFFGSILGILLMILGDFLTYSVFFALALDFGFSACFSLLKSDIFQTLSELNKLFSIFFAPFSFSLLQSD